MAGPVLDGSALKDLEQLLIHFVYEEYLGDTWRGADIPQDLLRSFAAHTRHLSDAFTLERREFKPGYLRRREYRSAYLLYFHLANLVRTLAVLAELKRLDLWPRKGLRVLDVGCGSAPSLQAAALACEMFGGKLDAVEAWDAETGILKDARRLWTKFAERLHSKIPPLRTKKVDLRLARGFGGGGERFDLVVVSNVLNEMDAGGEEKMLRVLGSLLDRVVAEDGKLIVIEPALNRVSRRLMLLRDAVLESGKYSTPAPCGHAQHCPLNAEPKDWCHFEVSWEPPPLRGYLEQFLEHRAKNLKYSYVVFERGERKPPGDTFRVLSDPLDSREGTCLLLCSPERKTALYYDPRSESGKILHALRRGDRLRAVLTPDLIEKAQVRRYALEVRAPADLKVERA